MTPASGGLSFFHYVFYLKYRPFGTQSVDKEKGHVFSMKIPAVIPATGVPGRQLVGCWGGRAGIQIIIYHSLKRTGCQPALARRRLF